MLNTASGSFNTIYKRHAQFDKLTQVVKSNTQLHVDIQQIKGNASKAETKRTPFVTVNRKLQIS